MILTIDFNKEKLQDSIETFFTELVRYLYAWLSTDGEVIGTIIGVYHLLIAVSIPIIIVISHTIYPSFWLKLYNFLCLFFIFMQHLIFNACLLIPMEEKLTKKATIFYPMIEQLLEPTGITLPQFITYIVISEGIAVGCFGLEIVSHVSRFVYTYYGIDI
jgi:hypothetical protein